MSTDDMIYLADSRGRVYLGKRAENKMFALRRESDGRIILTPYVAVRERDLMTMKRNFDTSEWWGYAVDKMRTIAERNYPEILSDAHNDETLNCDFVINAEAGERADLKERYIAPACYALVDGVKKSGGTFNPNWLVIYESYRTDHNGWYYGFAIHYEAAT